MSADGANVRRRRLFQKSASRQYLHAKSLTRSHRDELAQALEHEFRHAPQPEARQAALGMWLSVQQARLRTHDPAHRQDHDSRQAHDLTESVPFVLTIPIAAATMRERRRRYYSTPLRPEYRAAFDSFMRVIGDPSLDEELRNEAAARLEYHWHSEGTIAPLQRYELEQRGVRNLAESGYRASTDPARIELTAGERSFVIRTRGQTTTPDIWASALRSEIDSERRNLTYVRDPRDLPTRDARIRMLERDLNVAERTAAQARAEAGIRVPDAPTPSAVARARRGPSQPVLAAAREWLSSRRDLSAATPTAIAQALEAELADLAEDERPENERLNEHDYQILVETVMAEVTGHSVAERRHGADDVQGALARWQQIRDLGGGENRTPRGEQA